MYHTLTCHSHLSLTLLDTEVQCEKERGEGGEKEDKKLNEEGEEEEKKKSLREKEVIEREVRRGGKEKEGEKEKNDDGVKVSFWNVAGMLSKDKEFWRGMESWDVVVCNRCNGM